MQKLKDEITEIIQKDNIRFDDFREFLYPLSKYFNDDVFVNNLNNIIDVIVKDRNGDSKFDLQDLKLLASDILSIGSIVSGILLVIKSIPNIKITYNKETTEELIFKVLAYIFLVIVPSKINKKIDLNEKMQIVNFILIIYNMINTSDIVKQIFDKIKKYFENKGWCKCVCNSVDNQEIFEKHIPKIQLDIATNINKHKDTNQIQKEIEDLKQQLFDLQSNK